MTVRLSSLLALRSSTLLENKRLNLTFDSKA
jgi:hypothetical protein